MATQTRTAPPPARIPPNQTLYITNIPSAKIRKNDLKRSLYLLFTTYGSVLDVVALKTMKMRGQAHVVMKDIQSSSTAMRELQGFEFFGEKMKIEYAKSKSNKIAQMDGTFKMPERAEPPAEKTELQRSIFAGPPPSNDDTGAGAQLPSKENGAVAGTKRPREEDEEDKANDEDEDEDDAEEMEIESDDDE